MTDEQWKKTVEHVRSELNKIPEEATTTNCKQMGLDSNNKAHRNVSKLNISVLNALLQVNQKGDIHQAASKFLSEIISISTNVLFGKGDIKPPGTIIEQKAAKTSVQVMTLKDGNDSIH